MTSRMFLRATLAGAVALALTLAAHSQSAALAGKAPLAGVAVDRLESVTFR